MGHAIEAGRGDCGRPVGSCERGKALGRFERQQGRREAERQSKTNPDSSPELTSYPHRRRATLADREPRERKRPASLRQSSSPVTLARLDLLVVVYGQLSVPICLKFITTRGAEA